MNTKRIFQGYYSSSNNDPTRIVTSQSGENINPICSPNGTRAAFTTSRDGNHEIYVMDSSSGGNISRLTNNSVFDKAWDWSPDGTKLVIESDYDLWIIDNDGSNPTKITNDGTYITHATWSPDGNWIMYTSYDAQDNKYIHVIRTDGTDKTPLNGFVSNPDWITSPN